MTNAARPSPPATAHPALTRRAVLVACGAGLLVLAACGSDGDGGPAAADGPASEIRRVSHSFGTTEVPDSPERVVTVGLTDQDPVIALGVAPVASQPWYAEQVVYPWAEEALPGVDPEMLPATGLNLEAVLAQRPDLIIAVTTELTDTQYEQLSQIAPTVAAPEGTSGATVTWQQQTEIVGEALGLADEAVELVAEVEDAYAEVAAAHPDWAGQEAVLASQYIEGQLLVYPSDSPVSEVLERLGFARSTAPDGQFDETFGVAALSAERLDLIDVDLVLFDGYEELLDEAGLFDLPTYQSLAVVQEDRVVFPTPEVADALSFKNVLSLPWALERLEEQIATALEGHTPVTGS